MPRPAYRDSLRFDGETSRPAAQAAGFRILRVGNPRERIADLRENG
jgi:hypothetical protein